MVKKPAKPVTPDLDGVEGSEVFEYHELNSLEAMSLEDIERIWDLVPTEDQDYLTRRYRKSLKQHEISSDEQEIQMADQYLQRYQYEGLVPAGDQWVRLSASRRQVLKSGETELAEIDDDESGGFPWMTIAIVGFGIFLVIFVISRFIGSHSAGAVTPVEATETLTPTMTWTPSPTATITPTPTATPIALVESDIFIEAGDGRNREFFPVQLQVIRPEDTQARVFIVQERAIDLTEWTFDPNPDVASWISGTSVRPIFGIPYSESNQAFMESLASGSEFIIRMNTGSELDYRFVAAQELGRENTALLRQDQPGIVLVLIGETDADGLPTSTRYFVTGSYNPGLEVDLSNVADLPAEMGETVQFPSLSITVDQSYVVSVPNSQSNTFMYAVVDVTLIARDDDVALSGYQWFLDADDSRYSPDLSLTSGITYATLPSMLAARQTIHASVAFLVHRFDGDALFLFSPPGVAGESFLVNFSQPPLAVTVENLDVQLRRIRQSSHQVYVDVRVYNPQADAVTLQREDIGMIFGFTPLPIGATARPLDYEAVVFEPESSLDLTLIWDWNADDPFARLAIAGRVWSITLVE